MDNILYSLSNSIHCINKSNTVARRAPKRRRTSPTSLSSFALTGIIDLEEESQADDDDLSYSPANSRRSDTPDISDNAHSDINSEGPSTDLAAPIRTRRHPWKCVLKMTSLSLDPIFQRYLTEYGPDPENFLSEHGRLIHKVGSFSSETRGDAFMACYQYTQHLECQQTSEKVRWCFSMLNLHDVIQIAWPERKCIGHAMVPEVVDYLGLILGPGKLDPEKTKKDLQEWFCLGRKLNFLCEQFGPGCFFYLGHVLSHDLYAFFLIVSSFTQPLTILVA